MFGPKKQVKLEFADSGNRTISVWGRDTRECEYKLGRILKAYRKHDVSNKITSNKVVAGIMQDVTDDSPTDEEPLLMTGPGGDYVNKFIGVWRR